MRGQIAMLSLPVTRPRNRGLCCAIAALAAVIAMLAAAPAMANDTVPVTLKITKVACASDCDEAGLEAFLELTPDFYAKAALNGAEVWTSPRAPDNRSSIEPTNWSKTWEVAETEGARKQVVVGIEIYDHDSTSADDLADVDAKDADNTLNLTVDLTDGSFSEETSSNCSTGDGGANDKPPVLVCYEISTGDRDGDGLLDRWETDGIDTDHDGSPELDLKARGADPNRKDIFVEVDYMADHNPDDNAINDVIAAFANSPEGIALHVEQDEQIPHANNITTWADFDSTKKQRFGTVAQRGDADVLKAKRLAYRYSLWAHMRDGGGSSGRGELRGNDFMVTLGGGNWGANGAGHNVGTRLQQAGTFMHELGHNLGLDHGGGDGVNCKPNYVSVMNYTFQTRGIPQDGGGERLDYSAAVRPAFVGKLDETALNEGLGIKTLFANNDRTIWSSDADTTARTGRADQSLDWNGVSGIENGTVTSDINNLSKLTTNTVGECGASPGEKELKGFNDWTNLDIKFRDDAASKDGTHGPTPVELTDTEAKALDELWLGNLSVSDASLTEGDAGTDTMRFVVSLSQAAERDVAFSYATADGSAQAPGDYVATSASVTIAKGQTTAAIDVPVKGDTSPEPDETLRLLLSNPAGAKIDDGEGIGTIKSDPEPSASIAGATIVEESAKLDFTVSLSEANNTPVKVDYATADGTAGSPADYDPANGTVEFGVGETTKTVSVQINEDAVDELDEKFTVKLSNVRNANLDPNRDTGTGTIIDDDRDGSFSCRASGLIVGTAEPSVSNGPNQPCRDDARVARQASLGGVTINALSTSTNQTPDDLSATKPQVGDKATAHAEATTIGIQNGLNLVVVQSLSSDATAECRGGALPELKGSSRVALLSINGKPLATIDGRVDIPLVLATLRLNQTVKTRNGVVQRALVLDNLFAPDVVIGEAKAGFAGTGVHPNGSPCTA